MKIPRAIIRTADICDEQSDAQVCELQFRNFSMREDFHGEAVTFETYEDNEGLRDILGQRGHGRILLVDGKGSMRRALCGGNIAQIAFENGWSGLIFNGAVRDSHEFVELDFGVKALGVTAMRPRTDGIGREGVALAMGGVFIRPGSYVYADRDAVIILPEQAH